jgi:cyclomaltodextrin glucanotransferase
MTQGSEETPAFKIIRIPANSRQKSPAIAQGDYRTLYVDRDIVVFERREQQEVVIVAVNRGDNTTIAIPKHLDLAPSHHTGLLT